MTQPGHCRILIGTCVVLSVGAIVAGAIAAGGLQAYPAPPLPSVMVEQELTPAPPSPKEPLGSRTLKGVVVWIRGEKLALGVHADESPVVLAIKTTTAVWINGKRAELGLVRTGARAMVLVVTSPEGVPVARAIRVVDPGSAMLDFEAPST